MYGDAITTPDLETKLIALADAGEAVPPPLLAALEEYGGPQLFASNGQGKWTLPWVGNWRRVWTSRADGRFGGAPVVDGGGRKLLSVQTFVYGPGKDAVTTEALYASPDGSRTVLTRLGDVENAGGNYFDLGFNGVQAYDWCDCRAATRSARRQAWAAAAPRERRPRTLPRRTCRRRCGPARRAARSRCTSAPRRSPSPTAAASSSPTSSRSTPTSSRGPATATEELTGDNKQYEGWEKQATDAARGRSCAGDQLRVKFV